MGGHAPFWHEDGQILLSRRGVVSSMAGLNVCASLVFLVCLLVVARSAKITMLPLFGGSHLMTTQVIGEELARRGHDVTLCLPNGKEELSQGDYEGQHGLKIMRYFQGFEIHEIMESFAALGGEGFLNQLREYYESTKIFGKVCTAMTLDKRVTKMILDADLLISEMQVLCFGAVARHFNKKWVALAPSVESDTLSYLGQVYLNPSYVPSTLSQYSGDMTFYERVWNFLFHQMYNHVVPAVYDHSLKEFASNLGISHKGIMDLMGTAEMYLGNCDFTFISPYPQMPNERCVGPYMAKAAKKLPKDLEDYVVSAKHGLVLVAFGTLVDITKESIEQMAQAFGRLNENVLWSLKDTKGAALPRNIKISDWLPQNDLLGHPNTKLFVSHMGQSSMLEAGYHGVPVLAVPFGGDQHANAALAVNTLKMGVRLELKTATQEEWYEKVQEVLQNKRYKENALKVSRRLKGRKQTPVEYAGELIQYVLDNDCDVSHLRSPGRALPWYAVNLWDVYAFLLLVFGIVLFVLCKLVGFFIHCLWPIKTKRD